MSDSVIAHVGNTPLVRLPRRFAPGVDCEILLKLEYFNPGGSVKDRIGLSMILEAEQNGSLLPGGTVVEATSGNTGVGLALVAAARGYSCVTVMPDRVSQERIDLLRAFGAEVVLTPSQALPDDPEHFANTAERIAAERHGSWLSDQFHNPANPEAHERTTGPEIWSQTEGAIDSFVAGCGTGGTITGTARYLKSRHPDLRVVAVDPEGSIYERFWREGKLGTVGPHAVEGVGQDRLPTTWDPNLIDIYEVVGDRESFALCRRLAREAGIFAGGSAGMALAAALREGRRLPAGARIVVVMPDTGSRYLSRCFNDDWLRDGGFLPPVEAAAARVSDLLRDRPTFELPATATLAEAHKHLGERGVRPLPVVAPDGHLLGTVDERRLLKAAAEPGWHDRPVTELIAPAPPILDATEPWTAAVERLAVDEAVLVRTRDGWSGLTRRELLRALPRIEHADDA